MLQHHTISCDALQGVSPLAFVPCPMVRQTTDYNPTLDITVTTHRVPPATNTTSHNYATTLGGNLHQHTQCHSDISQLPKMKSEDRKGHLKFMPTLATQKPGRRFQSASRERHPQDVSKEPQAPY